MHMSDALVSAAVGTTMAAVSTGLIGYSVKKLNHTDLNDNKIPMMGVMGAFVFAAQMINFTIPGTGSSGHIGGGILLAALLGPYPAFLTLTTVLMIQALFFADGGLLALGCNIFNIAFFSSQAAYPLIFRPMLRKKVTTGRLMAVSIISVIVGLQFGALSVVAETTASGVTELPFDTFLLLMQPIHLVIGLIEGVATGAVLCFVYGARKEIILHAIKYEYSAGSAGKKLLLGFLVATVFIGGFLSLYASQKPDGLEWSIQSIIGTEEPDNSSKLHEGSQNIQATTVILPDYSLENDQSEVVPGTSVAGIAGAGITLLLTAAAGFAIRLWNRNRKRNQRAGQEE